MKLPVKASYLGNGEYRKYVVLDANIGLVCKAIDKKTAEEIADLINATRTMSKALEKILNIAERENMQEEKTQKRIRELAETFNVLEAI